ncbi:unnamed protein product [Didymodactylos carnosus]|uniref:PLAT domain-containing protein n=1 Tax=Didymodactylos carnosus TaxID=1234261 RepID=A0A8S2DQ52_9BILA|nr:unnamed protein product [Didymodactylos carnosus]CAF3752986.1 unnamed protein product [Didymodactylos carnosus]
MEVYTSSSGFKHAMGQCSHSAVPLIAYQPQPTSYMIPVALMPVHCSNVYTYAPPSNQQVAYTTPSLPDPIRPASRSSHKMSSYNSLMDPHMQDYYAKKFGRKTKRLRTSREEALYRITIKTADKKDAGTNAKVFLSIYGSKDKICRKPLTRETILRGAMLSASLNRPMIDLSTIEFKRGATDVVYIRCRDLGIIRYIILEHSGVLFEQSWLCECILITNVRTARSWYFFCGKWLSLFPPGDGSLTVELFPGDRIEDRINDRFKSLPETTEFEIICVTGDKRNAGTDANVYITLFGKESKTKKIHLQSRSKNPFERGQSDTFNVKAEYVGELDKIRIEHDNTGSAPGWFLERVVITDRYDPDTKYFASCNKWLARDEGDGQISRDLVCSKDVMGSRKLTVITGNKMGAGTDADVYLTLFGQLGESGAILLDDKKNNFEKGATDHFDIECPSVGEIDKILIAHNNKGAAPGWFLDKILIDDIDQRRTYEFRCQKWLATDEGDGQISRFLLPVKGHSSGKQATEGIPYTVSVTTGDKINAGTNARVYLIMYGEQDDNTSGKIFLSDGTFERERTDIFHIDGPYGLSPLAYIDIGHDDSGMNPGWYLGNVVIDCPSTGIKQTFHCDKWLATDEGDRRIERRLFETKREVRPPSVPWYVWVYTSDIRGAGTDSDVSMVLYGSKGKTDDIKLVSKSNSFEAGECDEFKVDAADVGKPYKLRVGHNNKRAFAPWHLDRIEMENLSTKKRYIFHCGKWLSKKDGDKQTIRELPAEGPGIDHPLPVVHYLVDVHTGKKRNAGTDANVFLNIFGDYGDTGERPLEYSSNKNKFENGQVDTFNIEAVTLNRIKKLRVGHDGQGAGAGWFLEKIVVREQENKDTNIIFMCNRWLASDEDDGQLVRELTLDGTQHLNKTSYHINIKTGDVLQAGTDADVHIKIFGEKGDSDVVQLRNAENTTNKFERNRIDKFTLEFSDLGKIRAIRIGHNGKGLGSGWFLDYVEIDVPMRGELYRFSCHRWLDSNEGDGLTELELQPSDIQKKTRSIPYEITVFTGDKPNAGTDASVFIQIYGVNGKTEELKLGNKSDTFERKKVDKFKLEATDVGQIVKIRIGHDSKGLGSGWFLEKVLLVSLNFLTK